VFSFELVLVTGYLIAFAIFVTQSVNFIFVRDNAEARAAASAIAPELPSGYEFGTSQPDNALLGAGWYWPRVEDDDDGAWSRSAETYVYLPVPARESALDLEILGQAYVAPGHETVHIALTVDGAELGQWIAQYGQPAPRIEATVPESASADGILEVRLSAVPLAIPYHYDRSNEKRKLGFLLSGMTLAESGSD